VDLFYGRSGASLAPFSFTIFFYFFASRGCLIKNALRSPPSRHLPGFPSGSAFSLFPPGVSAKN